MLCPDLLSKLNVYPSYKYQISSLIAKNAPTKVPDKYIEFTDVFSPNLASKLSEYTGINDHTIKLVNGQQPPYGPIYNLGPIELKTLKAYIKTNLANGFIKLFKSPTGAPLLFDRKSDGFLRLCVNYQDLNKLTIKNRYPLLLIGESLNRLEIARWFIQLNFISAYYQIKIRKGNTWKIAFKTRYNHFEY